MDTKTGYLELAQLMRKAASVLESMAGIDGSEGAAPKIMDLRERIILELEVNHPRGMSSREIAAKLYSPDMGITFDRFLRRVNVMVSDMHTKDGTIAKGVRLDPGRTVSWRLLKTAKPPEGGDTV